MCPRLVIRILSLICFAQITKSQQMCDEYSKYIIEDYGERQALITVASQFSDKHLLRIKMSVGAMINSVSN